MPPESPSSRPKQSHKKQSEEILSTKSWIDQECDGCNLPDVRLNARLRKILGEVSECIGGSIPFACQDWANTKAAYRFCSNDRVSEEEILRGHFQSTRERAAGIEGPILVLHDTSEFVYKREDETSLGVIGRPGVYHGTSGKLIHHTVRGILMHSSLAVSPEGLDPIHRHSWHECHAISITNGKLRNDVIVRHGLQSSFRLISEILGLRKYYRKRPF